MTTHAATSEESGPNAWQRFRAWRKRPTVRTPIWKRITSLISLGSIVVIVGVSIAALLGILALLLLVVLESAAR